MDPIQRIRSHVAADFTQFAINNNNCTEYYIIGTKIFPSIFLVCVTTQAKPMYTLKASQASWLTYSNGCFEKCGPL
jgi:hypothetical protein